MVKTIKITLDQSDQIFYLLGSKPRLKILQYIVNNNSCFINQIAEGLKMKESNVRKHLKFLEKSELIKVSIGYSEEHRFKKLISPNCDSIIIDIQKKPFIKYQESVKSELDEIETEVITLE